MEADPQPKASEGVRLIDGATSRPMDLRPRRLILAGYTGRDQEDVRRHIEELRAQGIPSPASVPELYSLSPGGLQVGGHLAAGVGWSSGEIEFVLFETAVGLYAGIGSDHTDRDVERTSFVASKQAFRKVIAPEIWPATHLANDWDNLRLRSWITCEGQRRLYQESELRAIMMPADILSLVPKEDRGAGLVLFSGTVPAVEPPPQAGFCRFDGELLAPDGRSLARCSYSYEAGPAGPSSGSQGQTR